MNADGSGQRRLTRNTSADIFPPWSPDGRKIAFDGGGPIHVMNADGSGKRLLTRNGGGPGPRVWSPDGRKIAFTGGDRNGWDVYVMNADGSGQRNLTRRPVDYGGNGIGPSPAWSPDGRKIAFDRGARDLRHERRRERAAAADAIRAASLSGRRTGG